MGNKRPKHRYNPPTTSVVPTHVAVATGCNCPTGCLVGAAIPAGARTMPEGAIRIPCSNEQCTAVPYMHGQCYDKWEKLLIKRVRNSEYCIRAGWSTGHITGSLWTPKMNSIVRETECKCPACGFCLRREMQEEKDAAAREKALLLASKPPSAQQPTTSKTNKKNLPVIAGGHWIQTVGKGGKGSSQRKMFKEANESNASRVPSQAEPSMKTFAKKWAHVPVGSSAWREQRSLEATSRSTTPNTDWPSLDPASAIARRPMDVLTNVTPSDQTIHNDGKKLIARLCKLLMEAGGSLSEDDTMVSELVSQAGAALQDQIATNCGLLGWVALRTVCQEHLEADMDAKMIRLPAEQREKLTANQWQTRSGAEATSVENLEMARVLEMSKADVQGTSDNMPAHIELKVGQVTGYSACRNFANIHLLPPFSGLAVRVDLQTCTLQMGDSGCAHLKVDDIVQATASLDRATGEYKCTNVVVLQRQPGDDDDEEESVGSSASRENSAPATPIDMLVPPRHGLRFAALSSTGDSATKTPVRQPLIKPKPIAQRPSTMKPTSSIAKPPMPVEQRRPLIAVRPQPTKMSGVDRAPSQVLRPTPQATRNDANETPAAVDVDSDDDSVNSADLEELVRFAHDTASVRSSETPVGESPRLLVVIAVATHGTSTVSSSSADRTLMERYVPTVDTAMVTSGIAESLVMALRGDPLATLEFAIDRRLRVQELFELQRR